MSNRRSKPTVERRNGAKSKALRMLILLLMSKAGTSRGRDPVADPPGVRAARFGIAVRGFKTAERVPETTQRTRLHSALRQPRFQKGRPARHLTRATNSRCQR